jgi:hypothetical protein
MILASRSETIFNDGLEAFVIRSTIEDPDHTFLLESIKFLEDLICRIVFSGCVFPPLKASGPPPWAADS